MTNALTSAMEAMLAGERACEAAARAAAVIMRGGGGFDRISTSHGPAMMKSPLSYDFYGHNMNAPDAGDLFAIWIYGPIFAGFWMDPGRSAASLAPEEYRSLLKSTGFRVVAHIVEDQDCGGHTIWLAQAEH